MQLVFCGYNWYLKFHLLDCHFLEIQSLSDAAKNEMILEEKDADGNEVPLGEMMKILKSQGAKKKKNLTRHSSPSDMKKLENEIDVLGVVREINLDNMKNEHSVEDELTKENELSRNQCLSTENNTDKVLVSRKRKDTNGIAILNMPTPKRKRSAPMKRSQTKNIKGQSESKVLSYSRSNKKKHLSFVQKLTGEGVESTNPDLLVSQLPNIKSTNKNADDSRIKHAIVTDPEVNVFPIC